MNYIQTFTGKLIDPLNPDPDQICIEDIAHALSNICRFGGHSRMFYSVAQHSVRCSQHFNETDPEALAALLHDASEAYLMDIPSPIKHRLPEYLAVEDRLMTVIAEKFRFQYPLVSTVKAVDKAELRLEMDFVLCEIRSKTCTNPLESYWDPGVAEEIFLFEFKKLESIAKRRKRA
ncbi:MAG: hypothetical protein AB2L20_14980 [Mangrovibacterium sp.]